MMFLRIMFLQIKVMLNDLKSFSLLHRLMALLIDYLVLTLIFTGFLVVSGSSSTALWTGGLEMGQVYTLLFYAVLTFFFVNSKLLFDRGQSVGKMMMSLKIVSVDDKPVSRKQILKRFAFYWGLWLIPVYGVSLVFMECLFAVESKKGAGHDRFAGTKVVSVQSDGLAP